MELYVLDELLRRTTLIDTYESLIWTERFAAWGDFELVVYSTVETRSSLTVFTHLAMNQSTRVMTIESVENNTDAEGVALLTVKGRSFEAALETRIAKYTNNHLSNEPEWVMTGRPSQIVNSIFQRICVTGALSVADKFPFIGVGSLYPPDTILESPEYEITVAFKPQSVYSIITEICNMYDLGFRLTRDGDKSKVYFNVYLGSDRTTLQNFVPPVVFSPNLDNLQNISELTSIAKYKNVAYVVSKIYPTVMVYADGADENTSGFNRRVLLVSADDLELEDLDVNTPAVLAQRGKEALAEHRSLYGFDGELNENSVYKYGEAYNLGDLVEMRNADGITNQMRVTEQIFVSDTEGERSYPTLTINRFITPGSWLAWDYNQVWDTVLGEWVDA